LEAIINQSETVHVAAALVEFHMQTSGIFFFSELREPLVQLVALSYCTHP
jgi:hypothetical protein